MRSRTLVVLVGVVAIVLAASLTTASAKPKATTTLTLLMPTTLQRAVEIIDANFERIYPDIHVQATFLPSQQLAPLLATQVQAGNAPDLFFTQLGRANVNGIWPLADAGRLLDLSGSPWVKRLPPSAKSLLSWKGKVYAWSLQTVVYGAVYNVDLFKQLGLKIPANFGQVLALCRKVAAAGKIPFTQNFGAAGSFIVGHQRYGEEVYGADPKWDDKRAKNQVTFASSPGWRRTLQGIVDMKDAGCFQPGSQGTSPLQQDTLLAQGQAVMSLIPSAELPNIYAINPSLKLAWFNVPPQDAKNAVVVAIPQSIGANAATKYPAQVKTYLNFIAREQQSTLFAKVAGGLSVLDVKKGNVPANMSALVPFFKAGKIIGSQDAGWPNTLVFTQAFQPGIQGLITGQTNVDGILADMDKAWSTVS